MARPSFSLFESFFSFICSFSPTLTRQLFENRSSSSLNANSDLQSVRRIKKFRVRRSERPRSFRLSASAKMFEILTLLNELNYNLITFLFSLIIMRSDHRVRQAQSNVLDFTFIEFSTIETFEEVLEANRKRRFVKSQAWNWIVKLLQTKIKQLIKQDAFEKFRASIDEDSNDSLIAFSRAKSIIVMYASSWLRLIDQTIKAKFSSQLKNVTDPTVIFITVLCHLMHPNIANNFQSIMNFYLYQKGARRKVLNTFNQSSLIIFYKFIQRRLKTLIKIVMKWIKRVDKLSSIILDYDNYDYTTDRRDERMKKTRKFVSIITTLMIKEDELAAIRLLQFM